MKRIISFLVIVVLLNGCASAPKWPSPSKPYYFSANKKYKPLFDGYKVTYEDYKNFAIGPNKSAIVWEYARLRKVDISQRPIAEAEKYFAQKAKNNPLMPITEAMDSYFKEIASDALPRDSDKTYEYDRDKPPAVYFFPVEKAKWNGCKVTSQNWGQLDDLQKSRFIAEGTGEIERVMSVVVGPVNGFRTVIATNKLVEDILKESPQARTPMLRVLYELFKGSGLIQSQPPSKQKI